MLETLWQIERETGVSVDIREEVVTIHFPTALLASYDVPDLLRRLSPFVEGKALHLQGPSRNATEIRLKDR